MDQQESNLVTANKLARLAHKANSTWDGTPLNHLELPLLDRELLNVLFDCVYGFPVEVELSQDLTVAQGMGTDWLPGTLNAVRNETLRNFLVMVEHMVRFNHHYRWDMKGEAFRRLDRYFHFEPNSEGTDRWLGRALAIKDLYHLNWTELVDAMKMVEIRK